MNKDVFSVGRSPIRTVVNAELRQGFCEKCNIKTVKEFYMDGKRRRVRMVCPKCGGLGRLIVRSVGIQPPPPPQCVSPRCLFRFILDTLFCALLSSYHRRRCEYAQANKHKKILERYRTGEPSPKTLWQAIYANLKLACPICRKYNVDPLLFKREIG